MRRLVSIAFRSTAGIRDEFCGAGPCRTRRPAWRAAARRRPGTGSRPPCRPEARAWSWDRIGAARIDRWVAEAMTGYAEEVLKLAGALRVAVATLASVDRSTLAIRSHRSSPCISGSSLEPKMRSGTPSLSDSATPWRAAQQAGAGDRRRGSPHVRPGRAPVVRAGRGRGPVAPRRAAAARRRRRAWSCDVGALRRPASAAGDPDAQRADRREAAVEGDRQRLARFRIRRAPRPGTRAPPRQGSLPRVLGAGRSAKKFEICTSEPLSFAATPATT